MKKTQGRKNKVLTGINKVPIVYQYPWAKVRLALRDYTGTRYIELNFMKRVEIVLTCERSVYPHTCAEGFIASRNHGSNKVLTHISDRELFKTILRQIVVVLYTNSENQFILRNRLF